MDRENNEAFRNKLLERKFIKTREKILKRNQECRMGTEKTKTQGLIICLQVHLGRHVRTFSNTKIVHRENFTKARCFRGKLTKP